MSLSLLEIYCGRMENRKFRFNMYSDAIEFIHGTGLGKGVRKQFENCVTGLIRGLAPDKPYSGFVDTATW